jgi:hypothetical protein
MPTGQYGQIYGQGVKYLKVNRYDSGGLDRSDYLGQLTNLTINYDDLGSIQYNIVTTQEQNDYFVYGIETRNQSTSSVNFNILSSSITIQDTSSFNTNVDAPTYVGVDVAGFYTVLSGNANLLGSFGSYKVPRTPNIQLSLTISASYTNSSGGTADTKLSYGTYNDDSSQTSTIGVSGITSIPNGASGVLAYKWDDFGSTILEDNLFNAKVFGLTTTNSNLNISNFKVIISQSQAPLFDYPTLTIFEPEFIDFEYNDYNALFGNAETPQFSFQFMDVDYTSNYDEPVNFGLIISGTADRAPVQDSNYSSYTWSALRYWGSRYNSFLQPQSEYDISRGIIYGDFNDISTDGSGYGALPAVEQNQTFIAYFDGVGGTGPELIGQTAYFIKYLIDTEGNTIKPEPGNSALYNLIDNFESGKDAIVKLIGNDPTLTDNPNDDALTGLHPITHVGRISPILITETGSGNLDYIPTMSFANMAGVALADAVANLTAKFQSNMAATFISNTSWATMQYQNDLYSANWTQPFAPQGVFRLAYPGGTITAGTRIRLRVSFFVRKASSNSNTFQFRVLRSPGGTGYQDFFYSQVWNIDNTTGWFANAWTDWFDAGENDDFEIQYRVGTGGTGFQIQMLGTAAGKFDTTFNVEQETPSTSGFINGETGATSSYWSIGTYTTGSTTTVLTSSNALYNLYTAGDLKQITPTASSDFGFSDITLPFEILPGDYIRFQYNENRRHCITDVSISDGLHLTVVPPVATSSLLDHFIVYRVVNDGTYVVLNIDKPVSGSSFTGIIQPEYVSQELTDKYSNIIQDLTQRGVIS